MILLASGYQTALDPPGWRAEPRFFNLRWQVAIKTSVAVAKYGFSPERWRRLGELVGVSQIWRRYPLSSSRFKLRFPCATTRLEKPLWTREMLETCQKKKQRKSGIQHFMVLDSLQMERLITGDHVMVPFIIWTVEHIRLSIWRVETHGASRILDKPP